ncbi:MAG TPA: two-component system response regulator CreB [Methylotenera sp.]|nr:two-component system response regulator CreB [Methylotenera sp.]HPH06018.1 two-component system response regulator CreB [Methylotenera sp.]HPN00596.1 two-component system response regulator CreB [Methylotenera sp.]
MPHHILIVEDEPAIAETLIYACKEAGINTTHCLLGHEAIATTQKNSYDFIVLDVGLPDMTGFDVCKKIRESSQIPILFLTARNHEIDRIVGLEIGADDYVTKPFSPREIVARIHAILRRSQNGASNGQDLSNHKNQLFKLDEAANRIQYRGEYLDLTRYEYLLLKTLIAHPQRVYSRDQLMDIVWAQAENTLERTVDAHIKTLRAKLRKIDAASEAIVTHRGMGYSLLA